MKPPGIFGERQVVINHASSCTDKSMAASEMII